MPTAPPAGSDTQAVERRLAAEVDRLKPINDRLTAFHPEIRPQVFKRLLAAQAGHGGRFSKALVASLTAGLLAALVAGAWYERHASAWAQSWHWLQHGWGSPWVFMVIVFLVAVTVAGLVISGASPVGKVPGKLVAVAAGITAITGATLALYPNLGPSTEKSFTVQGVQVERNVSLVQYMDSPYVHNVLIRDRGRNWRFPPTDDPRAQSVGTVVDFNFQEKGLRQQDIGLRWVLFDAQTSERISESDSGTDPWCTYLAQLHPSPCLAFKGSLKDLDINSFGFWLSPEDVTTTGKPAKCLFVRIEAYGGVHGRLSYADSPAFPRTPGAKRACTGVASHA
jgi:hypothetical protein